MARKTLREIDRERREDERSRMRHNLIVYVNAFMMDLPEKYRRRMSLHADERDMKTEEQELRKQYAADLAAQQKGNHETQ